MGYLLLHISDYCVACGVVGAHHIISIIVPQHTKPILLTLYRNYSLTLTLLPSIQPLVFVSLCVCVCERGRAAAGSSGLESDSINTYLYVESKQSNPVLRIIRSIDCVESHHNLSSTPFSRPTSI